MSSWESAAIIRAKEVNDKISALGVLVDELSTISAELVEEVLSPEAIAIVERYRK